MRLALPRSKQPISAVTIQPSGYADARVQRGADRKIEAIGGVLDGVRDLVLGTAITMRSDLVTGTTTIPYDDTIPQATEGTEVLKVTYVPKKLGSKIRVEASAMVNHTSPAAAITIALFKATTGNAVAATEAIAPSAVIVHEETVRSTEPVTWRVRIGASIAGTLSFNGSSSGVRRYGGVAASSIRVVEFDAA